MNEWRTFRAWLTFRPWQRHSLVLTVGGLVYILLGFSFFSLDPQYTERRERALTIALRMAPLKVWALCFVAAGTLAFVSSRWPAFSSSWGYAVLTGLSAAWASMYMLGYILADAPSSNITYGLVWGLMAFHWWAISGLVNPDRRLVVRDGPS